MRGEGRGGEEVTPGQARLVREYGRRQWVAAMLGGTSNPALLHRSLVTSSRHLLRAVSLGRGLLEGLLRTEPGI